MARNVNEIEADEEQQGAVTNRDAFLAVLADVSKEKGKIAKLTGNVSAKLSRAENDHNLDKKAFAVVHWATRQEPARLNSFLHAFDAYRGYADLDTTAGSDLFEGATKAPGKPASEANGAGTKTAAKAKNEPKAPRKPKAGPKPGKGKKGEPEPVSAAEAAAQAWGLEAATQTVGVA